MRHTEIFSTIIVFLIVIQKIKNIYVFKRKNTIIYMEITSCLRCCFQLAYRSKSESLGCHYTLFTFYQVINNRGDIIVKSPKIKSYTHFSYFPVHVKLFIRYTINISRSLIIEMTRGKKCISIYSKFPNHFSTSLSWNECPLVGGN